MAPRRSVIEISDIREVGHPNVLDLEYLGGRVAGHGWEPHRWMRSYQSTEDGRESLKSCLFCSFALHCAHPWTQLDLSILSPRRLRQTWQIQLQRHLKKEEHCSRRRRRTTQCSRFKFRHLTTSAAIISSTTTATNGNSMRASCAYLGHATHQDSGRPCKFQISLFSCQFIAARAHRTQFCLL